MANFYMLETTVGRRSLPGDTRIYVQLKDGSYVDIPVSEAKRYAGRSKTVFERSHIAVDFSELERALMEVKEGEFSDYKRAKERLHFVDEEGEYIPNLAHILRQASEGHKTTKFLDNLHLKMEEYAAANHVDLVRRSHINDWFNGNEIAPRDWRNFGAMAYAKDEFPVLEEFEKFHRDFTEYTPGIKNNSVDDNIYHAYLMYWVTRIFLGKKAKSAFNFEGRTKGTGKGWSGTRKVSLDGLKQRIRETFFKDINTQYCAVPLLNVTELEEKKKGQSHSQPSKVTDPAKKGIYIVKSNLNDVTVPKKATKEIVKDIVLLERSLINHVYSYALDQCDNGEHPISMEFFQKAYILMDLEERIRQNVLEKGHLKLDHKQRNACRKIGSEIFKKTFFSQEANKTMNLPNNAFQRFKDAYDLLAPVYPEEMEEYVHLRQRKSSLILMAKYNIPQTHEAKKKCAEKLTATLNRLQGLEKTADMNSFKYGMKVLFSEHIPDFIFKAKARALEKDPFYKEIEKKFKQGEFAGEHYTEEDIAYTLKNHNLEEFIEDNADIMLLEKLKGVSPSKAPLEHNLTSDNIL